jgi:hypothetical protein
MGQVGGHHHVRALRDHVFAQAVLREGPPHVQVRHRGEDPKGLGHDPSDVLESRQVLNTWKPPGQDAVELEVEAGLHLRVLPEQVPGPRQGVRRGLVARAYEGQGLVAKLLVAHPAALVGHQQQHGEQVPMVVAALPAVFDHLKDEPVQLAHGFLESPNLG